MTEVKQYIFFIPIIWRVWQSHVLKLKILKDISVLTKSRAVM